MLLFILSIIIICLVAVALYRHLNPQGTLLAAGISMLLLSLWIGDNPLSLKSPTGNAYLDIVKALEETFIANLSRAGLMIMTIGGYVAFMNHIGATQTLVRLSIRPLHRFRKHPMLAALLLIPIGQLLFITTPSAAGLGLLLTATAYPILVSLGVSPLSALSVIAAATIFDQGPGSANTAMAAELIGENNLQYFITHQIPLVLPTTCVVIVAFYLSNRYFDRRQTVKPDPEASTVAAPAADDAVKTPSIFALLPLVPILLLLLLSPYVGLVSDVKINTTVAMMISLFIALIFVMVHNRDAKKTFAAFSAFWKGMGNIFANVVTLIVASEFFSKGLIQMHFVDNLIAYSTHLGLTGIAIAVVFAIILFGAAMMMGSGNAAFFSFGPLLPAIAMQLGMPAFGLVLPLQLAASMGRAASPIAGIIVAITGVTHQSPMELAKRNMPPLFVGILFLLFYHFIRL